MSLPLTLNNVIEIAVYITPPAAPRRMFNEGLIVGDTDNITTAERVRRYTSADAMLDDGFINTDPEYLAAQLYFSQVPAAVYLTVGKRDPGAIATFEIANAGEGYLADDVLTVTQSGALAGTVKVLTVSEEDGIKACEVTEANEGSGYTVNDILTVVQAGASGGTVKVLTVDAGSVESVEIVTKGTGYQVANGLATTGAGSGAKVDITDVATGEILTSEILARGTGYSVASGLATTTDSEDGAGATVNILSVQDESIVNALTGCRAASPNWWLAYVIGATKAEHILAAVYIESCTPASAYIAQTEDADVYSMVGGNIVETLHNSDYSRSMVFYTTTDYAAAALLGRAMGLNTNLANSAFVVDFKNLVGVTAENVVTTNPLTETKIQAIQTEYGNVYVQRGGFYNWFEKGSMASARWFDQVLNLDMLANNIQLNVADLLNSVPKVPLTDAGVTQIIHAVMSACEEAVRLGYLAPGTWMGSQAVLNLNPGDPMPKGYVIQAPKVSTLTNSQRSARQSPAIYCACHEANAIQSVLIGVYLD